VEVGVCTGWREGIEEGVLRCKSYGGKEGLMYHADGFVDLDRCDEGRTHAEWSNLVLEAIRVVWKAGLGLVVFAGISLLLSLLSFISCCSRLSRAHVYVSLSPLI
jgi:hypothetical protein